MYTNILHFLKDCEVETSGTLKMLNTLTADSLKQKVYDEGRTLSQLAWHIIITWGEMTRKAGIEVDGPTDEIENPDNIEEFIKIYKSLTKSATSFIEKNWTNEMLSEKIDMYGEKWKRGFMLQVLIRHEIHHRGQLTVLMRQAGLKVPGIYGPSKEEWAAYGMPPAK